MRFRTQRTQSSIPSIQLIPMLNVIMGVLAFFVMTSMLLTTQEGVNVQLPNTENSQTQPPEKPAPLIVQLKSQGQLVIGNQSVSQEQLFEQIQTYLSQNPQGAVFLQADSQLPYEQVIQVLAEMRDVGGDRVSLAIDSGA
ncbi:MAG: biopolymer transporter ExbD [Coleofasciculus chthonoplastes F3-SA18-01]|uniref:ExbD/TolR family protein n=1 Tax=Coleofasciculus chthonoplastes TaxID=64178 RepID=UPI0032F87025